MLVDLDLEPLTILRAIVGLQVVSKLLYFRESVVILKQTCSWGSFYTLKVTKMVTFGTQNVRFVFLRLSEPCFI